MIKKCFLWVICVAIALDYYVCYELQSIIQTNFDVEYHSYNDDPDINSKISHDLDFTKRHPHEPEWDYSFNMSFPEFVRIENDSIVLLFYWSYEEYTIENGIKEVYYGGIDIPTTVYMVFKNGRWQITKTSEPA